MVLGSAQGWYLRDLNEEQQDQISKDLKKELYDDCLNYWDNWDRWPNGPQTQMIMGTRPRIYEIRKTS